MPVVKVTFQRCSLVSIALHDLQNHPTLRELKFIHSRDVSYWGDLTYTDRHIPFGCPSTFRVRFCTDVLDNEEVRSA